MLACTGMGYLQTVHTGRHIVQEYTQDVYRVYISLPGSPGRLFVGSSPSSWLSWEVIIDVYVPFSRGLGGCY